MMNRSRWIKTIVGLVFILALATTVYAANQPGSASDPIVTKSYVDEQMKLLKESLGTATGGNSAPVDLQFEAFQLKPGQKLIGHNGTEIIVRSGSVKVVAGDNGDGIPDLTGGADLAGGTKIPLNHHLLIPRTDNRGLIVEANSKDCWVMVRGGYDIK